MNDFNHFNKFTKEAKRSLIVAQEKAKEAKLNYVGTEHLLIYLHQMVIIFTRIKQTNRNLKIKG